MAAKNPSCTVTDSKKTGSVAKKTQIPPRAERISPRKPWSTRTAMGL
jgi:hypothetical protein